jgi:hypothetical protein
MIRDISSLPDIPDGRKVPGGRFCAVLRFLNVLIASKSSYQYPEYTEIIP